MDERLLLWFNHWNSGYELIDSALRFSQITHVKSVPFMLLIWSLWFLPKTAHGRTAMRERLTAVLLATLPIVAVTRALANMMPFRARPIHAEGLELRFHSGQEPAILDGWSSMPSDHASLFVGIAVALLMIHRGYGAVALFWAIFVVALPRIVIGLHWPSDILVGSVLGAGLAVLLVPLLTRCVRWTGLVPVLEAREAIGYPLLFFATFEVASMFGLTRYIVTAVLE